MLERCNQNRWPPKIRYWKWNRRKNEYFNINTECYSCSTVKYAYYPNLLHTSSPMTKKGNVPTIKDKTKQVNSSSESSLSHKNQKISHLLFL